MNRGDSHGAGHRWTALLPWIIIVAGFVGYANTFGVPFLLDDVHILSMREEWLLGLLTWMNPRALVNVTFLLNRAADGTNPAGYHAVNLVIHVGAALVLYGGVWRTLVLGARGGWTAGLARGVAAVSAALWVAHPLQTESVTYISQRYESLMGLMLLLTLYGFIRSVDSDRPGVWLALSAGCCWLGMETKEVMIVAPVLVALYDYSFVSKGWAGMAKRRWYYVCLAASWAFFLALRQYAVGEAVEGGYAVSYPTVPWWVYGLTQPEVILRYIRLAFVPAGLCFDYAWLPVESVREALLPVAMVALLGGATVIGLWRRHPAGFVGAWFFLILAPSSSILPLHDLAFEHRMYLPLAGIVTLAVVGMTSLLVRYAGDGSKRRTLLGMGTAVAVLAIVALTLTTARRNSEYASEETMWRDVVRKAPHNLRAGIALAGSLNQGRRHDEAESLARDLVERLRVARQVRAESRFHIAATDADVLYPEALQQLGLALLGRGDVRQAIECFREGVGLMPTRRLHHNLGVALVQTGRLDDAIVELDAATRLGPSHASTWAFKAQLLSKAGRFRESAHAYERAIACDAGLVADRLEYAWLLATCPDESARNGSRAVEQAEFAVKALGAQSVRGLDVLAAAYAEAGRFKEAVETVEDALHLLEASGQGSRDGKRAAELSARMEAYGNGTPHREPVPASPGDGAAE